MTWESELEEIRRRRKLAKAMGGSERGARHGAEGRTPVRDRIDQLLDDGSFREIGSLAGKVDYDETGQIRGYIPSNFITGRGTIDGRPVIIGCDDFTVRGGAADGAVGNKMGWSERTARELRLPLVRLVDGTGGGGSVRTNAALKRSYVPANPDWDVSVGLLSQVPVVAAAHHRTRHRHALLLRDRPPLRPFTHHRPRAIRWHPDRGDGQRPGVLRGRN